MLIQPTFYPFEMMSKRRYGMALQTSVTGPSYVSEEYGAVQTIDASAILDRNRLHVFATNRSLTEDAIVVIDLADATIDSVIDGEVLTGSDPKAVNTYDAPVQVTAVKYEGVETKDGKAVMVLPPLSFAAVSLGIK